MNKDLTALLERYGHEFSDFAGLSLTDVNQRGYGRNMPIHVAVQAGQMPDIELLLREGADVNAAGEMGLTPLHYAAMNGSLTIVELLLRNGARRQTKDMDGLTAADWAQRLKHDAVESVLR